MDGSKASAGVQHNIQTTPFLSFPLDLPCQHSRLDESSDCPPMSSSTPPGAKQVHIEEEKEGEARHHRFSTEAPTERQDSLEVQPDPHRPEGRLHLPPGSPTA